MFEARVVESHFAPKFGDMFPVGFLFDGERGFSIWVYPTDATPLSHAKPTPSLLTDASHLPLRDARRLTQVLT